MQKSTKISIDAD